VTAKRQCEHVSKNGTQCHTTASAGALGNTLCARHYKAAIEAEVAAAATPESAPEPVRMVGADRPKVAQTTLPGVDVGARAPEPSKRQAELGQWFTPPWLAAEVADAVYVEGLRVLEPSAGDGAIVRAVLDAGAEAVLAVEIDPAMAAKLRARFAGEPVDVVEGDFLSLAFADEGDRLHPNGWDVIVGNPPYDDGVDGDHLARIADLLEHATNVATGNAGDGWIHPIEASLLLRTVALHSGDRFDRVWQRLFVQSLRPVVDRVSFPPAGNVAAAEPGKIDVSIFGVVPRLGLPEDADRPIVWVREPEPGGK